ncbi:hypothetical protein HW452_17345, partial [Halomonas aquamarina]
RYSLTEGSNADGYYAIDAITGTVTLTDAGAAHVNGGGNLPAVNVTVTDEDGLTARGDATVGDSALLPTVEVTSTYDAIQGAAEAGQQVATSQGNDPDGDNAALR